MKKAILIALSLFILTAIIGCNKPNNENTNSDTKTEEFVFKAQIVKLVTGENPICYIVSKEDIGYGDEPTLITLNIPKDKLNDVDEKAITIEDLKEGNILEITSDGAFLESYPLQISNVYKVKVIEEGSFKDIEQYQDEVSKYYKES